MRDLEQARAEVFRRSEEKIQERTRMRRRVLTLCVPLALCLVIGAVTAPTLLRDGRSNTAAPTAQESGTDGVKEAPGAISATDEAALLLQSYAPQKAVEDDKKSVPGAAIASNGQSSKGNNIADDTADLAEYTGTDERRVTVTTPEGEVVYTISGDVLKCETEGWERPLTPEEAAELYKALEQPAEDGR